MIPCSSALDVASLPPICPITVSSWAGAAITKATHIKQRATCDNVMKRKLIHLSFFLQGVRILKTDFVNRLTLTKINNFDIFFSFFFACSGDTLKYEKRLFEKNYVSSAFIYGWILSSFDRSSSNLFTFIFLFWVWRKNGQTVKSLIEKKFYKKRSVVKNPK